MARHILIYVILINYNYLFKSSNAIAITCRNYSIAKQLHILWSKLWYFFWDSLSFVFIFICFKSIFSSYTSFLLEIIYNVLYYLTSEFKFTAFLKNKRNAGILTGHWWRSIQLNASIYVTWPFMEVAGKEALTDACALWLRNMRSTRESLLTHACYKKKCYAHAQLGGKVHCADAFSGILVLTAAGANHLSAITLWAAQRGTFSSFLNCTNITR